MMEILKKIRFSDPKTDLFLGANVLDAALTYIALQYDSEFTEFNGIIYTVMDTIGIGATLLLKVVLCIAILWILRKTNKEKLLVPISAVLVIVALSNLMLIRISGVEV